MNVDYDYENNIAILPDIYGNTVYVKIFNNTKHEVLGVPLHLIMYILSLYRKYVDVYPMTKESIDLFIKPNPKWLDAPNSRVSAPWSKAEEEDLLRLYKAGITIESLSVRHRRNLGGIESRLAQLDSTFAVNYEKRRKIDALKKEIDSLNQKIAILEKE